MVNELESFGVKEALSMGCGSLPIGGRGNLVVNVTDSWPGLMSSNPAPPQTHRVGGDACLICRELKRPPIGVVWYGS
ncbi:hypothetical protein TNCV_3649111 [Trichonephila clavipes]|nr:hypothetical protein TNCV_3649111 [Trichonephila clavipes]